MTIEQRTERVREVAKKLPPLLDRGRRLGRTGTDTAVAVPVRARRAAAAAGAPRPTDAR